MGEGGMGRYRIEEDDGVGAGAAVVDDEEKDDLGFGLVVEDRPFSLVLMVLLSLLGS